MFDDTSELHSQPIWDIKFIISMVTQLLSFTTKTKLYTKKALWGQQHGPVGKNKSVGLALWIWFLRIHIKLERKNQLCNIVLELGAYVLQETQPLFIMN